MRWYSIAGLSIILLFAACTANSQGTTERYVSGEDAAADVRPTTIKIASWNIENFGKSKASDGLKMSVIADIIRQFDIIAIQEISNVQEKSDPGCARNEHECPNHPNCNLLRNSLERHLNEPFGSKYQFIFSPQVKDERYLYIYNSERVTLLESGLVNDAEYSQPICLSSPDNTGKMVRQPFKAKFKVGDFDFTLLTAHTSPSINVQELEGLAYFYEEAQKEGEPDVIILGDLNADCSYLGASDDIKLRGPDYIWVIDDSTDTTVSTTDCAYDRFIFKNPTTEDFTGNWGIVREKITDAISDHYLIWAEFSTTSDSD
ncbi:MAG: Endonuclease/Exonuclease/phosphatase family protein [Dehalococcoidia bacterium]|nr:Endonuclease/Exonuclease/phosphatase family protein [Dehalococcoidia bacterium]